MKRILGILSMGLLASSANAIILFVDLNDAPREYQACADAVGQENIAVVNPSTINQGRRKAGVKDAQRIGGEAVEQMVAQLEAQGKSIEQIVISGHDGSGHFMGSNGNFYANELKDILKRHPKTRKTLVSAGLIGCYPNTKHGANTYWLAASPNIKQTVGFPVQSPTKEKSDTAKMINEYCKKGKEWADKSTKQELCEIYPNFARLVPAQLVSICSREAVASTGYGKDMCYSNEELDARCKDFDPGDKNLEMYEKFFSASDPCAPEFANPPVDKNAFYAAGASPLRKFYSQVHLWMHCAEDFRKTRSRKNSDSAYNMPYPPQMIRLIKYDDIKTNLARLNQAEFADYDQRLKDLCLDQFALGDIRTLSRAEMNRRIEGAAQALRDHNQGQNPQKYGWIDEPELYAPPEPVDPNAVAAEQTRAPASVVFGDMSDDQDEPSPPPRKRVAPQPVAPAQIPPRTPPVARPPMPKAPPRARPAAPPTPAPSAPVAPAPVAVRPEPADNGEVRPPRNPMRPSPRRQSGAPAAPVEPEPTPSPKPAAPGSESPAPPAFAPGRPQRPAQCGRPVPPSPQLCSKSNPNTHAVTDPRVVEKMANMMKYTMVDLNYKMGSSRTRDYRSCMHFHLVEPNAEKNYKSQCIVGYRQAQGL